MEYKSTSKRQETGMYRQHMGNELLKYLSFFEILIFNRLNMLLLYQIDASDHLFELLKLFMSKEVQVGSANDHNIAGKLLKCIALSLRNDKIGKNLMKKQSESKGLQQLLTYAQNLTEPFSTSQFELMIPSNHDEIEVLIQVMQVYRLLAIANKK